MSITVLSVQCSVEEEDGEEEDDVDHGQDGGSVRELELGMIIYIIGAGCRVYRTKNECPKKDKSCKKAAWRN